MLEANSLCNRTYWTILKQHLYSNNFVHMGLAARCIKNLYEKKEADKLFGEMVQVRFFWLVCLATL